MFIEFAPPDHLSVIPSNEDFASDMRISWDSDGWQNELTDAPREGGMVSSGQP